jgi:DNA primase
MSLPQANDQRISEIARPERRGVSNRTVIEEAKAKVSTLDLAERLCGDGQLRKVGRELVGCCPLPGHEDRSPSFTVDPEKGLWFCFGCLYGGDVIELARHAWGYEKAEVGTAAAILLMEFNHEVPERPSSWFARQKRQAKVRQRLEDAKVRRVQRRLYRWLFAAIIATFEDEDERLEEARIAWEDARELARLMVCRARGGVVA